MSGGCHADDTFSDISFGMCLDLMSWVHCQCSHGKYTMQLSLWVSLSWLGILFPVIFTYVHPQLQDTVATSVVYTKRHHVP